MKKFYIVTRLTLIFSICLYFGAASPSLAIADDFISGSVAPQETIVAYLESPDGEIKPIEGQLVSELKALNAGNDQSATYVFSVSPSDLELTKAQFDGSYAVKAYLTIYYRTQNNGSSVLLTGVSGHWTFYDQSVRVTNVRLRYGCDDVNVQGRQSREIASVSNYFSYDTGYQTYVLAASGVAGANIVVSMQHGTVGRTWSMFVQNTYCNGYASWFNTR